MPNLRDKHRLLEMHKLLLMLMPNLLDKHKLLLMLKLLDKHRLTEIH